MRGAPAPPAGLVRRSAPGGRGRPLGPARRRRVGRSRAPSSRGARLGRRPLPAPGDPGPIHRCAGRSGPVRRPRSQPGGTPGAPQRTRRAERRPRGRRPDERDVPLAMRARRRARSAPYQRFDVAHARGTARTRPHTSGTERSARAQRGAVTHTSGRRPPPTGNRTHPTGGRPPPTGSRTYPPADVLHARGTARTRRADALHPRRTARTQRGDTQHQGRRTSRTHQADRPDRTREDPRGRTARATGRAAPSRRDPRRRQRTGTAEEPRPRPPPTRRRHGREPAPGSAAGHGVAKRGAPDPQHAVRRIPSRRGRRGPRRQPSLRSIARRTVLRFPARASWSRTRRSSAGGRPSSAATTWAAVRSS